jgi:hypothetical protein
VGASTWRENTAGQPCQRLEPKKHKHFPPFHLATTVTASTTPHRDDPLPPVGTDSTAAHNPLQTVAASPTVPTIAVHPLSPPLLPPSPPRSHLAREVFVYLLM